MSQESIAHRVCRVIAGWYQDGVPGEAIDKHDDEFMSAIGREWAHNIHRERVPWSLGLYGSCGLQPVAIIAPFLALWATLGHLYADVAASLVGVAVAKQLPQSLASQVCGYV